MAKKGSKSQRGKAETRWGETKSAQVKADVTPTGKRLFVEKIRSLGISIAEFIERVGRGKIQLVPVPDSLRDLIEAVDLNHLAEDSGIPIERLTDIRDGRPPPPSPDERIRLCRGLDITPEQLLEAIKQQSWEK